MLSDDPDFEAKAADVIGLYLNRAAAISRMLALIARGTFTSKGDLARTIMRDIKHHNVAPKPIRWTYSNPERRIRGIRSTVTVH
jgi:hypothetical protein